jgi:hypothetical protein
LSCYSYPLKTDMNKFSAQGPYLGYLYQARYALFLLLDSQDDAELMIEKFDDVSFSEDGKPQELLQLKHHINSSPKLTDKSTDLWKTLRVWSTLFKSKHFEMPGTMLTLITTNQAPEDSIAAMLRPDGQREPKIAAKKLREIAKNPKGSDSLESEFEAFLDLAEQEQELLIEGVKILDASLGITDIPAKVKKLLLGVKREHIDAVYERLEGWWLNKVIDHLKGESKEILSRFDAQNKIAEIAEQFRPDNLPIDFLDWEPPDTDENRIFVHQLELISIRSERIAKAVQDYYRAFEQRSRWVREELVFGSELYRYEERLIEEWERYFLACQDDHLNDESSEDELVKCGREVYKWIEQCDSPRLRIRPNVSEAYIVRGSYHMLADRNPPKVGWHPKFLERLKTILPITTH